MTVVSDSCFSEEPCGRNQRFSGCPIHGWQVHIALRNRQEITWTFGCPIAPHLWPLLNRQILTVAHYTSGLAQSARPNLWHTWTPKCPIYFLPIPYLSIVVITICFEKGWFLDLKKVSGNWPKSIADKSMDWAKTQRECQGIKDLKNSINERLRND